MKKGMKVLATLLAVVFMFALVACGNKTGGDDTGGVHATYTDEENYAVFKAGVEFSLSYDDVYTYFETTAYMVDGVLLEIDKSYETRDGNRFMHETSEETKPSESSGSQLTLTQNLIGAVKLVTADGEQKYKYCHKQLLNDGSYEKSGSYIAEEDLGNYVSTEHSPKTVLSAILTADDTYADFVASLKKYIVENEGDSGATADKITVLIGRDSIETSQITVSAVAEGLRYERDGEHGTEKLVFTFVVKDGKVTECGRRSEVTTDKGNGTTGSINSSSDVMYKYVFDEERYDEIKENEYPVSETQEEIVV